MTGKVEESLISERKKSPLLFVLIDSEASQIDSAVKLAKSVEEIGAASILVGGSSATDQMEMAEVVKNLKNAVNIPIILFPSEKNQKSADFLGLNLSEYGKEFDKFVKETHRITGDVLITSPNDFNGLNEYLKNNF